jgi:outer membrane receptor for Fe3+-dicitrate
VKPYRQHYFETGVSQEVHPKLAVEVTGFYHTGDTPFEYREISITRLFLPINSSHARSYGVQTAIALKQLQSVGLTARLQYAYQHTYFYGPVAGGFAVGEEIAAGERFLPAFDEPHSGTLMLRWSRPWRNVFGGFNLRYGSGTAVDNGAARVPGHTTADLSGGFDLWQQESKRVQFQMTLTNLGDNRYAIAKESEETPLQYASPRIVAGHVKWYF